MKPRLRLHVGVNPLGEWYWFVTRGRWDAQYHGHSTLCYADCLDAVKAAALVLNCE